MVSCHVMDGDDSALKYDSNASKIVSIQVFLWEILNFEVDIIIMDFFKEADMSSRQADMRNSINTCQFMIGFREASFIINRCRME